MIRFKDVSFKYGELEHNSVSNINLEIAKGECVALIGPSGSGKSTLIKLLNLVIPKLVHGELDGEILIAGRDISNLSIQENSLNIGTVFQNPKSQFFNFNTTDEIVFGCTNFLLSKDEILNRLDNTVKRLNIGSLVDRNLFSLSGGEKQKIACASVYTQDTDIFLFDEPSSNLDYDAIGDLSAIISGIKEAGKTIVIAEHRLYYLMDFCDRFIYVKDSKILFDLTKDEFVGFSNGKRRELYLRTIVRDFIRTQNYDKDKSDISLTLKNVSFSYKKDTVLDIPFFEFPKSKVVGVVGKNGSGKSTFARLLCGLLKSKGEIWNEKLLNSKKRNSLFYMIMQDVNHQLFTESVLEELLLGRSDDEDIARAEEILQKLDLLDLKDMHPLGLSGGQKQRVAIACGIFERRRYLIFDEPTSGLDFKHMNEFARLVSEVKASVDLILIITHDVELVNLCCDSVVELKDKNLVCYEGEGVSR